VRGVDLDNPWPGVATRPLVAFAVYLVVLDFAGYRCHRLEHRFGVWREPHAVHHRRRRMSLGCEERNHLLLEGLLFGQDGLAYGGNFGILFPWWDMLFGRASWSRAAAPTGIRDQRDDGASVV